MKLYVQLCDEGVQLTREPGNSRRTCTIKHSVKKELERRSLGHARVAVRTVRFDGDVVVGITY